MSIPSTEKGVTGEIQVALEFCSLDRGIYHDVHNVTLEMEDGTTQIDHVIFSRYGIFVVETKNYSGLLYGSENNRNWTKFNSGRKQIFQNPLRQNHRHVRSLMEFLGLTMDKFHSVVAFCGDAEFKTPMPPQVITSGYAAYIKSKQEVLIPEADVLPLVARLKSGMLPRGEETNRLHIESLNKRHGNNDKYRYARPSGTPNTAHKNRNTHTVEVLQKQYHAPIDLAVPWTSHEKPRNHKGLILLAGGIVLALLIINSVLDMVEQMSMFQARHSSPNTSLRISNPARVQPIPVVITGNSIATATSEHQVTNKSASDKESAWARWYKPPPYCEKLNERSMVECGNHYIRARREFEIIYAKGNI